jgi:hypothetical protein
MSSAEESLRNRHLQVRLRLYRWIFTGVSFLGMGLILSGLFAGRHQIQLLGVIILLLSVAPLAVVSVLEARVERKSPSTRAQWARLLGQHVFILGFGLWSLGYALDSLWLELAALPIWIAGVIAQMTSAPPRGKKRKSTL